MDPTLPPSSEVAPAATSAATPGVWNDTVSGFRTTDQAYFDAITERTMSEYSVADLYKWGSRKLEAAGDSRLLSPDEANTAYGIPGKLNFSAPIKDALAKDLNESKTNQLYSEYLLANGNGNAVQKYGGGALGIALSFADPSNVALAVIPAVGGARYIQLLGRAGRLAMTEEALAASVAGRASILPSTILAAERGAGAVRTFGARFAVGAANNAVGALALEPLRMSVRTQEQTDYEMTDSLHNLFMAGVVGGTLHAGIGLWVDVRREAQLKELVSGLRDETKVAMQQGAVADLVNDRPVESPAELAKLDENVHLQDAAEAPTMALKYPDVVAEMRAEFAKIREQAGPPEGTSALVKFKQPFEMSREEFAATHGFKVEDVPTTKTVGEDGKIITIENKDLTDQYRQAVEKAILEGKPIPPEVLAQFPDLVREYRGRIVEGEPGVYMSDAQAEPTVKLEKSRRARLENEARQAQNAYAKSLVGLSEQVQKLRLEQRELRKQTMRDDVRQAATVSKQKALDAYKDKVSQPIKPEVDKPTDAPITKVESSLIEKPGKPVEISHQLETERQSVAQQISDNANVLTEADHTRFKSFDEELAALNKERSAYEVGFDCAMRSTL